MAVILLTLPLLCGCLRAALLAEPNWKPEVKGALYAVQAGQPLGAQSSGEKCGESLQEQMESTQHRHPHAKSTDLDQLAGSGGRCLSLCGEAGLTMGSSPLTGVRGYDFWGLRSSSPAGLPLAWLFVM